jgi:hypothetical protein
VHDRAEQAGAQFGVGGGDRGGDLAELGFGCGPVPVGGVGVGEHGAQDGQRGHRLAVQAIGQRGEQRFGHVFGVTAGQLVGGKRRGAREEFVLCAEVVHDKTGVDASRLGHGADRGAVVAEFGEHLAGRGENVLLGLAALLCPGRPGVRIGHLIILRSLTELALRSTVVQSTRVQ